MKIIVRIKNSLNVKKFANKVQHNFSRMTRQDMEFYATAMGLGRLFKRGTELRVLRPEAAFHMDRSIESLAEVLQPYGDFHELAQVLVAVFDDVSILQIYYDVRNYSGNAPISTILFDSFGTILSKRSMAKLKRDLAGPSRSPLAECMKRCGLTGPARSKR